MLFRSRGCFAYLGGLDWSSLDLKGEGSGNGTPEKKSSSRPCSNWFINKTSSSDVGAMVRLGLGLNFATGKKAFSSYLLVLTRRLYQRVTS